MAYVITDSCIKDALCVDVCPTDCIHPKQDEPGFEAATQLFVDPAEVRRRQEALHREQRRLLQELASRLLGANRRKSWTNQPTLRRYSLCISNRRFTLCLSIPPLLKIWY